MFINFVALMLINLVAGLVLLALYIYLGIGLPDQRRWVPGFAMSGFVALATGLYMVFDWPLPSSYNIAFGEMSVLLGVLFLGAALAQAFSWDLLAVTVYAFFAGLAAIIVGVGILSRGMTKEPVLAAIGYILAGLSGVLAGPVWYLRSLWWVRMIGALVLLAAAVIWAITGYGAYWQHLGEYANWTPVLMRK